MTLTLSLVTGLANAGEDGGAARLVANERERWVIMRQRQGSLGWRELGEQA
jgi:hypothetical protein